MRNGYDETDYFALAGLPEPEPITHRRNRPKWLVGEFVAIDGSDMTPDEVTFVGKVGSIKAQAYLDAHGLTIGDLVVRESASSIDPTILKPYKPKQLQLEVPTFEI